MFDTSQVSNVDPRPPLLLVGTVSKLVYDHVMQLLLQKMNYFSVSKIGNVSMDYIKD